MGEAGASINGVKAGPNTQLHSYVLLLATAGYVQP